MKKLMVLCVLLVMSVVVVAAEFPGFTAQELSRLKELSSRNFRDVYLLEELNEYWENSVWNNETKDVYYYNAAGFPTEMITYIWLENSWIYGMKTTLIVNINGLPIEMLIYIWDPTNQVWLEYASITNTFNANGYVTFTLMSVYYLGTWYDFARATYTYDANDHLIEKLEEELSFGSTVWENEELTTYTWSGDDLIEKLHQDWDNGAWINSELVLNTYDGAGHLTQRLIQYWTGNSWNNSNLHTYTYNAGWNMIEELVQYWLGGIWINLNMIYQTWDDDLLIEILQMNWTAEREWINDERQTMTYGELPANEILNHYFNLRNYPNPFNPSTTISFSLTTENTELIIYNLKGQKVKTLTFPSGSLGMSEGVVFWNGDDDNGNSVASGVYFCRLKSGEFSASRKMLLLK